MELSNQSASSDGRDRWAEARDLSQSGLAIARGRGNTSLLMALRLLSAESSSRIGEGVAAGAEMLAAFNEHSEPSLELVAEANRVAGALYAAQGNDIAAGVAFDRARRVFEAIGHAYDAGQLPAGEGQRSIKEAESGPESFEELPGIAICRAAALFDQANRADLLGLNSWSC